MALNPHDLAFPSTYYYDERPIGCSEGLTIRQYFAIQALQGYLAACGDTDAPLPSPEYAATESVKYADALIKALDN